MRICAHPWLISVDCDFGSSTDASTTSVFPAEINTGDFVGPLQLSVTASETDTATDSTTFSGNDVTGNISTSSHDVDTLSRPESISNASSDTTGSKYSLTTVDSSATSNSITGSVALVEDTSVSFSNYESDSNSGMSTTNTETGTSSSVLNRSGNDILGSYTFTETSSTSTTVVETDDVAQPPSAVYTTSATTTAHDSSSVTTTGNDVTGASSSSETGSSTATLTKTDSYGSGDADSQTITTTGTSSSYQSGNDITGSFSLSDTSSEAVTSNETGTRNGNSFTATSTDGSTATSQETGNSITGAVSSSETTTDSTSVTDTGTSSSGGGYTIAQLDHSTATVTGNENTITGTYTQATSSNDTTSVGETSSPVTGSLGLTSNETTSATTTGSETGDTITGAYSSSSTESDGSTLTQSGNNSSGTYSLTATTNETSATIGESGNTISGDYTFSEAATQNYSFSEANSSGMYPNTSSFALTETGTKAYSVTQSGSHVTGGYSLHETGTDSYTIAESGGTSSGGGGGGGGGSSSGSSSNSSTTWGLTLYGADNYTTNETGNELSSPFSRTTTGGGTAALSESGSLATTYYNHSPSTNYSVAESGNYLSGALSLTETGTDRYGLIQAFNNVSDALPSNGNGPGDVDYSPVGAPFHIGAASPLWGHGPAANLTAAASDAAFNELGLDLLHEYCWAGDQPYMVNSVDDGPIESAREGQSVLAANEHDPEGPRHLSEVGKFFKNGLKHVINLYVEGRLFRPTPNHTIYVRERGFVPAGELRPGDELLTDDHRWVKVSSVVDKGEVVPVFNLFVPHGHTYFVGSKRNGGFCILVHNVSPNGSPVTSDAVLRSGTNVGISNGVARPGHEPMEVAMLAGKRKQKAVRVPEDEVTAADKQIAKATQEVIDEMKKEGWKGDPADNGAYGTEVHKRVAEKMKGQKGWYFDVYVDKETNEVLSIGEPPKEPSSRYTQVDAIHGKDIKVGSVLDSSNVNEVYDIKTAARGKVMEDVQATRLKRVKYGVEATDLDKKRIRIVTPAERWTRDKGWHAHPRFGENGLKMLQFLGPATAAYFMLASDANAGDIQKLMVEFNKAHGDSNMLHLWIFGDLDAFLKKFIADDTTVATICGAVNAQLKR